MTVVDTAYPRGSEWRMWDLHIHTPFSAPNNGFGQDFDVYARTLLSRAVELGIAAIGVTDYFLIDGFARLRAVMQDSKKMADLLGDEMAEQAKAITLFPNLELRSSVIVTDGDETGRVNFHLIFDPALEPTLIEEHFLRELHFTAQANPSSPDNRWSLTSPNLIELGQRLKQEQKEFGTYSDLAVGMMNAVVAHEDVTRVLERQQSRFAGRYLFVVSADEDLSKISWSSQGHQTRKLLYQKAHMLFSANPATREFGLGRRHSSVAEFTAEFGGVKPCIHGSDAHSYEALFEPDLKRYLWIKADPTFEGLRQVLFEPETRVFIGTEPPTLSRTRERATRFMDSLTFAKTSQAKEGVEWFSGQLPLNIGLVAIIGNKGGGKSALSDVLALLGEARSAKHFSFLTVDRFLAPRVGLGDMFTGEVRWRNGQSVQKTLSAGVDETSPELVKYIPQGFLEEICTELHEGADTQFDRELRQVIFSHVGVADRLGKDDLASLIAFVTEETDDLLDQVVRRISVKNQEIVEAEAQQTAEYRRTLLGQLAQREKDLAAHMAAKPPLMAEPSADPEQMAEAAGVKTELEGVVREIEDLDRRIAAANEASRAAALRVASADRMLERVANLERQLEAFYSQSGNDAAVLELDPRAILSFTIDREPIRSARSTAQQQGDEAKALLADTPGSLPSLRDQASKRAEGIRERLDEPTRRYEEYRRRLAGWEKDAADIQGNAEATDSVSWLKARIEALKDLPERLESLKTERGAMVSEVFEAKLRLLGKYRELYAPVQEFIDTHPVAQQQATLQFSASVVVDDFIDTFLEMIHQGRKGSFQGDPEGSEMLEGLLSRSDFSSLDGVTAFLAGIEQHLRTDMRVGGKRAPVRLEEQLRQGYSISDVYDYLYGLRYLSPRFELLWQGKRIQQLSPGERGNLLLLFYLLIDKRDVPLIIDQPEENLDNHTIATALIPALKFAKAHRQIVIVTHNPNLAVVCDAEQIVHAQIDKTAGNEVIYTAGAIEDPKIAQLVVDVLEGTMPAFDVRDAKYEVLERFPQVATSVEAHRT